MMNVFTHTDVGSPCLPPGMPPTASTTGARSSPTISLNRLVTYGLLAAMTATAANSVLLVVAHELFDVPAGFPLAWGPVLASSVIPAVGAAVVYGVLAHVTSRPNRAFGAVAAVVLALSFVPFYSPPPELSQAPPATYVTLIAMHVAAAACIVGLLTRVPHVDTPTGASS